MARSAFIRWEISGITDLRAFLSDLKPSTQAKIIQKTIEDASKPIISYAKQLAPKKTGALKKSIGAVTRVYPRHGRIVAFIGARKGHYTEAFSIKTKRKGAVSIRAEQSDSKNRVFPANYSHLVEFGHRSVHGGGALPNYGDKVKGVWNSVNKDKSIRKGTISATSFVAPHPFLRPAFEQGKAFAERRIIDGFEAALKRELSRAKAKYTRKIQLAA